VIAPVGVAGTNTADAAQHRKLVDAAQQFEAMFLQELLKPMTAADKDGDVDDGQGDSGTLQSFGTESLAKSISSAGGLGIARSVVAEIDRQHANHEPQKNSETELKSSPDAPIESLRRLP